MSTILQEATDLIYGDREETYGEPHVNLERIAGLWNAYLDDANVLLGAEDVALMMILLKVARLKHTPDHRDSLADVAGYAALIERINERWVCVEKVPYDESTCQGEETE